MAARDVRGAAGTRPRAGCSSSWATARRPRTPRWDRGRRGWADRRRRRRRADQPRVRRRPARTHDGGPGRPRRPAPRRLRRRQRRLHQCHRRARPQPGPARRSRSATGFIRCSGIATVTPTMLEAGVSRNVTPPPARAVLDVRSTPELDSRRAGRRCSASALESRWSSPPTGWCRARRRRARACSRRGAVGSGPQGQPFGSARPAPTGSSCGTVDAIKCGPGTSRRSHTPDEYVDLPEVSAARRFYVNSRRRTSHERRSGGRSPASRPGRRPTYAASPDDALVSSGSLDRQMLDYTVGDDRLWDARLLALGRPREPRPRRRAAGLGAPERRPSTCGSGAGLRRRCGRWSEGRLVVDAGARGRAHRGRGLADPPARAGAGAAAHRALPQRPGGLRPSALPEGPAPAARRRGARPGRGLLDLRARQSSGCSGPATPTPAGRCHPRPGSGRRPSPRGCSIPPNRLPVVWARVDRSPLGSAAGYGVPLPLKREAAARALGFGAVEHNVAVVQNGRGKLEAAVLFWCVQLGHELAKLAHRRDRSSARDEYGFLVLPSDLATGSSIMPHKRNPDLFELTRAARRRSRAISSPSSRSSPSSAAAITATSSCSRSR